MKILSFHPFSLFTNGGGNRILRRLYQGHEQGITALVADGFITSLPQGNIKEVLVLASPVNRKWMRWPLRNIARWMRHKVIKPFTTAKLQRAARQIDYDIIHVVSHGPFCAALATDELCAGKQLWVSFHDHFNTAYSTYNDTRTLWQRADRRLVISEEMAAEYTRLFGQGNYEVITDGVTPDEIKQPRLLEGKTFNIYFAGLLHLHYMPLFEVLANALDVLAKQGYRFKLVLRGTQQLPFLTNRQFQVDYRAVTLDNDELKAELDEADILYLPIKFTSPDFYLYSLSTKMVGYLAAPGAILYHGPADSAACNLLKKSDAALCSSGQQAEILVAEIQELITKSETLSANAKKLAAAQFDMHMLQARFWQQS